MEKKDRKITLIIHMFNNHYVFDMPVGVDYITLQVTFFIFSVQKKEKILSVISSQYTIIIILMIF